MRVILWWTLNNFPWGTQRSARGADGNAEFLDLTPCHLVCSHTKWWETFNVPRLKCATQRHICNDCVASVIHKWMSTERWRNDGCGVNLNYSDKTLSLCHIAHFKSHSIPKRHSGRYLNDSAAFRPDAHWDAGNAAHAGQLRFLWLTCLIMSARVERQGRVAQFCVCFRLRQAVFRTQFTARVSRSFKFSHRSLRETTRNYFSVCAQTVSRSVRRAVSPFPALPCPASACVSMCARPYCCDSALWAILSYKYIHWLYI